MKILKCAFMGLTLFLSVASSAWCANNQSLLSEAASKYQSGDFASASEIYQGLIKNGVRTAAIYYNLGNAQFRGGQLAQALISYERAMKLNPRDADTRWNIGVLKSAFTDKIDSSSDSLALFGIRNALSWVSLDELFALTLFVAAILAFLALLTLFIQIMKPFVRMIRPLLIILLIIGSVALGFKYLDSKDPRLVITAKEVVARYGPSNRETQAFTLHLGAEGHQKDETGDWIFIELSNKSTGWIPKSSCEKI